MINGKTVIITMISKSNAKLGYKFIRHSYPEECLKCSLKHLCADRLEEGRIYQVINIRKNEHYCKLINDKVKVVEVIEPDIICTVPTRIAFEGSIITYNSMKCNEVKCVNFVKCNPIGLKNGDKCKLIKRLGKANCIKGEPLTIVILSRVPNS